MNTYAAIMRQTEDHNRRYTTADLALRDAINAEYRQQIDDHIAAYTDYHHCGHWDPAYNHVRDLKAVQAVVGKSITWGALTDEKTLKDALWGMTARSKAVNAKIGDFDARPHVLTENLLRAVKAAIPFVSTDKRHPSAIKGLRIRSSGPYELEISATNLESFFRTFLGARVPDLIDIVVPGKLLAEVLVLSGESLRLMDWQGKLSLMETRNFSTIKGTSASDCPPIPNLDQPFARIVDVKAFKVALLSAIQGTAKTDQRPMLCCVNFTAHDNALDMLTCDSVQLTTSSAELDNFDNVERSFMVPANALRALLKALPDDAYELTIAQGETHVSFSWDRNQVALALMSGRYPVDPADIVPTVFKASASVDLDYLLKALKTWKKSESILLSTDGLDPRTLRTESLHFAGDDKTAQIDVAFDDRFEIALDGARLYTALAELGKATKKSTMKNPTDRRISFKVAKDMIVLEYAGRQVTIMGQVTAYAPAA